MGVTWGSAVGTTESENTVENMALGEELCESGRVGLE